jgi:hypothetical protein
MNSTIDDLPVKKNEGAKALKRGVWMVLIAALLVTILIGFVFHRPQPAAKATVLEDFPKSVDQPIHESVSRTAPATTGVEPQQSEHATVGPNGSVSTQPPPIVDGKSHQLVEYITRADQSGAALKPEQITEWKQNLQQLIQQGPQSIPAILEFLKKNQDVDFGSAGKEALGYGSARRAMFDALAQIGGAEGSGAFLQVLQQTADPKEISLLADHLAKLAPGEHTSEILQATRDVLEMASGGKLPNDDVGPLFEVLQKYGDQTIAGDLEKNSEQWKYYSAIALANLPNGAGVPALVKMAQDGSNKLTALQMLAQVAQDSPDARATLLEQARGNKITSSIWPYLVDPLAGREYHFSGSATESAIFPADEIKTTSIKFGNQNIYSAPSLASSSSEFLEARLALVNDLKSVTSDPAGLKALQESQLELTKRLEILKPAQ